MAPFDAWRDGKRIDVPVNKLEGNQKSGKSIFVAKINE
jgi:hypothetical protein